MAVGRLSARQGQMGRGGPGGDASPGAPGSLQPHRTGWGGVRSQADLRTRPGEGEAPSAHRRAQEEGEQRGRKLCEGRKCVHTHPHTRTHVREHVCRRVHTHDPQQAETPAEGGRD